MNFEQFNARINELWAQTKAGKLPRADRFAAIERLTDEYIAATGRRPDPSHLDRLASLCLYEELTDKRKNKMRVNEYPIMGKSQYMRKTEGLHIRKENSVREVSFEHARNFAVDGRDHTPPIRRYASFSTYSRSEISQSSVSHDRSISSTGIRDNVPW